MNKEPKAETKRCAMVRNSWKGLFLKNGTIGKIILNDNFELIDGYCTYLILKKHDANKVPVYFE